MQPVGPLIHEHRLIERMIGVLDRELRQMKEKQTVNPLLIDAGVDFFRTYADRTHHGKEEDVLFRDLQKKNLAPEHQQIVNELIEEHEYAREMVGRLLREKDRYVEGEEKAIERVIECLEKLIQFYPTHIDKEDNHFFLPCMDYFTEEEKAAMLDRFHEVDRRMIHEKYANLVAELE